MIALWLSRNLLPALAFGVTIPLWLMIVAGGWLWLDKSSAVRQAVDRAVSDLVHSAELDAARAREKALRLIIAERERQAERDRAAAARFAELYAAAEHQKEGLADELAELSAHPAPDSCVVDSDLLDRLRR